MSSIGLVTGFAAGGQTPDNDIEARVAARTASWFVGMAGLTEGNVGLGLIAMVDRISPAGRVPRVSMTECAVETAGLAGSIGA